MLQSTDPIERTFRLSPPQKKALAKLGLFTLKDLFYHFPHRHRASAPSKQICDLSPGEEATVTGAIKNIKTGKTFRGRMPMAQATFSDGTGSLALTWFHQPYLAKMLREGSAVRVVGKVTKTSRGLGMANPAVERTAGMDAATSGPLFSSGNNSVLSPLYPESRGITSLWFEHAVKKMFQNGILKTLADPLPEALRACYHLPSLSTALVWIHTPKREQDSIAARKRFAFEEIFFIQLGKQQERHAYKAFPSFRIKESPAGVADFLARLPFALTVAQHKAIAAILADLKKNRAMTRLLEGDVGSGKTAVAAATIYAVVNTRPLSGESKNGDTKATPNPSEQTKNFLKSSGCKALRSENQSRTGSYGEDLSDESNEAGGLFREFLRQDFGNLQCAYMAPTEILAQQHFASFIAYFAHLPVQVGLITGSGCKKFPSKTDPTTATDISRAQLLKWVANGEIPILIGTHALIQKSVSFKNLAYVVIDEQHRFGTSQRSALARGHAQTERRITQTSAGEFPRQSALRPRQSAQEVRHPHFLSMTATPIPRTLALTIYGDLDLTVLDEMPAGRKPIITEIVLPHQRSAVYENIRRELKAGRQCYIICPRIDEPDPEKELALYAKSATEESKRLKEKVFPEYEIGLLHSKMKPSEKDEVMRQFVAHEITILVATSVVEVGVSVRNATVIIIEGAERFGLAQLHQLRGRVIRSEYQAYCYAFTESTSGLAHKRLHALKTAKNGFELAELDLKLRGAGDLYGRKQWGITDVGMEAIKNLAMVEAARTEAQKMIEEDPELVYYPLIKEAVALKKTQLHFE